jgi:hypothetical protein
MAAVPEEHEQGAEEKAEGGEEKSGKSTQRTHLKLFRRTQLVGQHEDGYGSIDFTSYWICSEPKLHG